MNVHHLRGDGGRGRKCEAMQGREWLGCGIYTHVCAVGWWGGHARISRWELVPLPLNCGSAVLEDSSRQGTCRGKLTR